MWSAAGRHDETYNMSRGGATCRRRGEPRGLCKHRRHATAALFIRLIRRAAAALFALRPERVFGARARACTPRYVRVTRTVVGKRKCFSFEPGLVWSTLRLSGPPSRDLLTPPRSPPKPAVAQTHERCKTAKRRTPFLPSADDESAARRGRGQIDGSLVKRDGCKKSTTITDDPPTPPPPARPRRYPSRQPDEPIISPIRVLLRVLFVSNIF